MRIALITLALAALAFIGSIIYSMSGQGNILAAVKDVRPKETETSVAIETLKYQIKTDAKIDELSKKIDELSKQSTNTMGTALSNDQNGSNVSGETNTGVSIKNLPISGKFLAKIMPTFSFTVTENSGIFGIHIFDMNTQYTTYLDEKLGTSIIISNMNYDTLRKNIQGLGNEVYTINETKVFPFRSFYLNPPKQDTLVRIVMEIESQAIAIQIPKTKFKTLKDLLLKK